ncbi:glycosyltransferase [Kytococcus schroeteri]|uniref:Glycosyltransferase n=1 Tax=Kytococcus schroeteri TaxID=138300 RepID=A0A2I1PCV2_9MICO|nr:glycosyltransferase [Kytococcus schroeteri]PKZ42465.1 glycosyltransferase [Kytococcus schroeteri]
MTTPSVTVVVPHHDSPERLARLLQALRHTTLPADRVDVVVADDGSPTAPVLPTDHPLRLRLVRQERRGFRAAAARNLGAAAATGEVLVLLDGDMLPEPDCLRVLAEAASGPVPTLVVGRRRHHDAAGWTPAAVTDWLTGHGPAPVTLPEPAWLAEGLAGTDHLRAADDASFRYVISAVMAVPRAAFLALGGFDETFVGYGGEDWELAQRAWLAGWDLRHRPDAVAWHDGPEISGRPEDLVAVKNAETAHLATRLTHPLVRGRGLVHALPDLVVEADASRWTLGQGLVAVESWLRRGDTGVWFGGSAAAELQRALAADPRVHPGSPDREVLSRCRWRVRTSEPVTTPTGWEPVARRGVAGPPASPGAGRGAAPVQVARTRDLARARLTLATDEPGQTASGWHGIAVEGPAARLRRVPASTMVERARQEHA